MVIIGYKEERAKAFMKELHRITKKYKMALAHDGCESDIFVYDLVDGCEVKLYSFNNYSVEKGEYDWTETISL